MTMNLAADGLRPFPRTFQAELWYVDKRMKGLSRFAIAITVLNILGHFFLGFEQSWITPILALGAAYGTDLIAETVQARADHRPARYSGSFGDLVGFLLSAHISALAVGMLLAVNDQWWIVPFAAATAVGSKWIFRLSIEQNGKLVQRHFLNPSNFGITATLVLFPSVGIAPPYMFTENISGVFDWLLPLVVIGTGSLLNIKLTGRWPLILAWVASFALQAMIRSYWHDAPLLPALLPMTGFAFILFTFYMITDPGTTPSQPVFQVAFAAATAAMYGLFMELHIVFGLFYALTVVTFLRGSLIWIHGRSRALSKPAVAPSAR